ncbi:hypothetical protein DBB36_05175 [Flavobacterium sp. WLB]|uniref:hypothetical protein n=1 Tax=Flavobacterium TaxID=237 RepID=UPI0006AB9618|nr:MULTISPECIES: hypothetical protein [Flavobacterium]KOP40212.1 hypothetical protein AKO67_00835 [Flavobacterium sp. VMW]OWU91400.1 hypothetical protein APR43_08045 [Flavobacterium sp. NLM]PUU71155.1 hypothetical protein DBB36_05175 [Flavobacterium sp. WLB]UUF16002.1 hypothetical protein NLJ00_07735 [Flavobacterium panici]
MARIFVGFMICFLLLNCSKKQDIEKNIPYIISKESKGKITGNDTIPPTPPIPGWLVYGTNTFIINTDSTAYYFQNKGIGFICGTPNADTIPYFINLQPKDLIQISNKNLYEFIKLNYKDNFRNATFIASESDTLKSKMFFDLFKSLNYFKRDRDFIAIRRTTQEEDTVLKYKRGNESYYPSEHIKWDKTKIKFPEFVKFVKKPK